MDIAPEQAIEIAMAHHHAGRLEEAELIYRQILQKDPHHPEALHYLGVMAGQIGRHDHAVELLEMARRAQPDNPEIHVNRGMAFAQIGKQREAADCYHEALRLRPNWVEVINLLGSALFAQGRYDAALQQYHEALRIQPGFLPAVANMGAAYKQAGRWDEAIESCRRLIELAPTMTEGYLHLAIVLAETGRLTEASDELRRALQNDPHHADGWDLLGQILQQQGQFPEAGGCHLHAILINAQNPAYHANLGDAVLQQGLADDAIDAYRKALALNPNQAAVHSRLLVAMGRSSHLSPREIYDEAVAWARRHANVISEKFSHDPSNRDPNRPLRIGYVSPSFCRTPLGQRMAALLPAHDRAKVEVFCYSDARRPDEVTEILKSNVAGWRDVAGAPDEQFCQIVHDDRIDILVDLAGHLPGNRLLAMARKPAPVQATWMGLPHTTGTSEIAYRIVDGRVDAHWQVERYHTEKIVHVAGEGPQLAAELEEKFREMWRAWCAG